MEQSLKDRGDGKEVIDTKLGGVHSTDSRLQPSKASIPPAYDMGTGLPIILNLERINAHAWNKV